MRKRYLLSITVLLFLTAGVMLLPNLLLRLEDGRSGVPQVRSISLASTEKTFTATEVARLIRSNVNNAIFAPTDSSVDRSEAEAHCRRLVEELFVAYPECAKEVLRFLDGMADVARVECSRFLTLSEGEVVTLTLVAYSTESCYICYEANSGILLTLFMRGNIAVTDWEFNEAVGWYYYTQGLDSWEYFYDHYGEDKIIQDDPYENIVIGAAVSERLFDQDSFDFSDDGEKIIY